MRLRGTAACRRFPASADPPSRGFCWPRRAARTVYLVQTVCACLTLVCFVALRYRSKPVVDAPVPTAKSLLEGMHFVRDNKLILSAISLDLFAVLFGGATALLPIYAADILHAGARGLGWLRAAPSVGSVTMALVLAHSPKIHRAGNASALGGGGVRRGDDRVRTLAVVRALPGDAGAGWGFRQCQRGPAPVAPPDQTPDYVSGRVLAFSSIFISSSNQFGAVESGWTAAWFGPFPASPAAESQPSP